MSALAFDAATVSVLWRRDLKRFLRQPSRVIGALGQPILFWLLIGSGMAATFRIPGSAVGYLEYFYPGVIMMVVLFSSIFASVSIIEDRHQGFLQAVLAGPGSRSALVIGKTLGAATVALLQVALFLGLAPWAGFPAARVDWPLLAGVLVLSSVGLTALGVGVAWLLDNVQAYHAIQMTLLVPLWIVSGAMFPAGEHSAFATLMRFDPVAHMVAATRAALYGGAAPAGTTVASPGTALAVVAGFALFSLALAAFACEKKR